MRARIQPIKNLTGCSESTSCRRKPAWGDAADAIIHRDRAARGADSGFHGASTRDQLCASEAASPWAIDNSAQNATIGARWRRL